MRFFEADEQTYEAVRAQLDAAAGYPLADGSTLTSIEPAASAPRDSSGLVLFIVSADAWHDAYAIFHEISENDYMQKVIPHSDGFFMPPAPPVEAELLQ